MPFLIAIVIVIILLYFAIILPNKNKKNQKQEMLSNPNIQNYLEDIFRFVIMSDGPIAEAIINASHVWLLFYSSEAVFEIRSSMNGNVTTERSIDVTYSEYNIPQLNSTQTKILKELVVDKLSSIPYIKPISMSSTEIRLQPLIK